MSVQPSPQFGDLPLYIDPVRGVRAWQVDDEGNLLSLYYPGTWTADENFAVCSAGLIALGAGLYGIVRIVPARDAEHDMAECYHGFYAYFDGSRDYRHQGKVEGVIEGYGEVTIGSRGFRCMKARIVALTFPVERTAPKPRTRGLAAWIWRYYDRHTRGHVPYHGRVFELNARLTVPVLLGGAVAVFGSLVLAATVTPMFLLGLLVWAPALAWNFIADRTRDRYLSWLDHPASRTSDALAPATAAKIRARYPDVPVYDTFEQMVAAHPIGVPEQYIPAVEPAQDAS